MGNFKQHVTCSTVTGIVIGGIAYQFGFSLPTCLLSAGLCSMAGMLPDIDSDSSRSFQECIYFAAGLCAVLFVDRLRQFSIDRDMIMLSGAMMFLFVRFGVGDMIKKMTAHRGMFHSIPAAVFSGQIVFFLTTGTIEERIFKGFALSAGYLSHLILDEICSIDSTGKQLRLKKSFGTALKFYDGKRMGITMALYGAIGFMGILVVGNPEALGDFDAVEEKLLAEIKSSDHSLHDIMTALTHIRSGKIYVPPSGKSGSDTSELPQSILQELSQLQDESIPGIPQENQIDSVVSSYPSKISEHHFFSKLRNGNRTATETPTTPSIAERMYPDNQNQREANLQSLASLQPLSTNPAPYQAAMPAQTSYQQTSYQQPIQTNSLSDLPMAQQESVPLLPFELQGFQQTSLRSETSMPNQSAGTEHNLSPYELAMQSHQNPNNDSSGQNNPDNILYNNYSKNQSERNNNPRSYVPPFLQASPQQDSATPGYRNNYTEQDVRNASSNDGSASNPYSLSGNDFAPRKRHQPGDMNRGPAQLVFPDPNQNNEFLNE